MKKRVALIVAILILGVATERAIYDVAILPRLAGWRAIPAPWPECLLAPLIIAGLLAGLAVRSWWDIAAVAVLGATWGMFFPDPMGDRGMATLVGALLPYIALTPSFLLVSHVRRRRAAT